MINLACVYAGLVSYRIKLTGLFTVPIQTQQYHTLCILNNNGNVFTATSIATSTHEQYVIVRETTAQNLKNKKKEKNMSQILEQILNLEQNIPWNHQFAYAFT